MSLLNAYPLILPTSRFYSNFKEKWEDLKKNISINPRGNHVRFVPIIANNVNRPNAMPPTSTSSRKLLFKPFIPKHITNYTSKENVNLTQQQNDRKNENIMTINHMKTHYPTKFNMSIPNSVNLQFSQNKHDIKKPKIPTSLEDKFNMIPLKNSLPKLPLHTIWTSNSAKDFGCTLPLAKNAFRKQFPSNLNCMPQAIQSTNHVMNSEYQTQTQVQPKPSTTINNSRFLKTKYSLSTPSSRKLYPITENMNTSFFTSDIENPSPASGMNSNTLIPNSLNCVNQPFNMDSIWKNW